MNAILGIVAFFVAPFIFLVSCLAQSLDWISDDIAHIGKVIAGWSFLLVLLVLLYRVTSNLLFMWLLIAALCLLLWTLAKRYCAKKWKRPSTPDAWICRKCGNENSNVIIKCNKCGATRPT